MARAKSKTFRSYCIDRESNPGLAEFLSEMNSQMATANFTTKPSMLDESQSIN
jgi:hypothetical protein